MTDLLEWLAKREAAGRLTGCEQDLATWLAGSSRPLADGWWHGCELDTAYAWAKERLSALGLEAPSEEEFRARHAKVAKQTEDEEELRRHQLGFLATHANAQRTDHQLFHCCGPALEWEDEEPPWVLLNAEEYRRLVAIAGPPTGIEAAYSGRTIAANEWQADRAGEIARMSPAIAQLKVKTLLAEGKLEEALLYLPRASIGGGHGLLGRLDHIETLRRLGKTEEARTLWSATADEWLGGSMRIWDTQWRTLLALHRKLRLSEDDPRVAVIREKA